MKNNTKIVAEVGSCCYDPDPNTALKNALLAINETSICGADAVKFQLFRAHSLYSQERAPEIYENIKKYELPLEWLPKLSARAFALNLEFWLSFFSCALIDAAIEYVDVVKIASGDLTNDTLIEYAAKMCQEKDKQLAISTGAANLGEIFHALDIIGRYPRTRYNMIGFHCVSAYPSTMESMNLSAIKNFSYRMRGGIGLSDHTKGHQSNIVAQMAVAAGYTVFEKHVNLSGSAPAPDDVVALNKKQFSVYVESIRLAESIMGNGIKQPADQEISERKWARRGSDGLRPVE